MCIAVGSDHWLFIQKRSHTCYCRLVTVFGLWSINDDRVDYPDFADKRCSCSRNGVRLTVSDGGTGIGIAMTADKVPGIRATPVQDCTVARACS